MRQSYPEFVTHYAQLCSNKKVPTLRWLRRDFDRLWNVGLWI